MAISAEAAQLSGLLNALTQPDTEAIRQAEVALKPLLKDPRSVPLLVEILKSKETQAPPVRHVAGILLRKRLSGHYAKFDVPTKTNLKAEILTVLANEPERTVRNGVVGVAASLAKLECSSGGTSWPELFQFIAAAAAADEQQPEARELAFWLLQEMTDTIGMHLKAQFAPISGLFAKALVVTNPDGSTATNFSGNPKVQGAAVKALGQLLSYLSDEPEVEVFAGLVLPIMQVAEHQLRVNQDEDLVSTVLDVMYDLSYSPSQSVAVHLVPMVQFALSCVQTKELEMGVRDSAALVIATLAEAKPKTFGKEEAVLAQVLETLFGLIENSPDSAAGALFESNPAWQQDLEDDGDDEFDPDADSPTETSMAQGTLDMLACEIPKKFIFQPAVSRCVQRLSSPQANHRKAGIACLGVIAEGCSEPLREHLAEVMPHVLRAAEDSDAQVRECACFCLGQISEHCQPEILAYSEQILPRVFSLLDDKSVSVQATSCYVLEMFCERLEPEAVRPLLDSLVRKLAAMLEGTTKRSVQEMAVAALAATAVAAEDEFTPYVAGVATLMTKCMAQTEEKLYSLRGRALECMGHIAIAVGRETFRPYYPATMECACEGLTRDSTDLHEFAYAVFANLSKVMKEEFAPALPELVPHLVEVIGQDEGKLEPAEEEKGGDFGALDDSDDEDDEGGNFVLHVRTALLEVKKGAITAIGEMAAHTGAAFCPFLEDVMTVLQKAANGWHPLIKSEVADAMPNLIIPSIAMHHNGEIEWTKGDVTALNYMSQHTSAIVSAVLNELITMMADEDKMTVGKGCEGAQSVIELCGPAALVPHAQALMTSAHELVTKAAPCQISDELFDGEFPEDDDDHDVVTQAACDLVGAFGRVLGAQFSPHLPQFMPAICEYAKSSRPASDRSMAIGWLSEVAQELEGAIFEYWQSVFLPAIVAGLADPSEDVKRNAAFCAGICCEHLRERVTDAFPQILQSMESLFLIDPSSSDSSAACVDNVAAAVARMIMVSPSHLPLPQVLPALLKLLPLKTDMTENETVYNCLLGLIQMENPDAAALKAEIKRVFVEASSDESKVDDEIKAKLKAALPSLL